MNYFALLIFLLTPAYAIRFSVGSLPTNALMAGTIVIWLAFFLFAVWKKQLGEFFIFVKTLPPILLVLATLFLVTGILSTLTGGVSEKKIAQFIVLFLQPLGTYLLAAFAFYKHPSVKYHFVIFIYFLLGFLGLLAAYQYFTLDFLPMQFWGNAVEPKRAIAVFSHPNFYALFTAPLLGFLLPDFVKKIKAGVSSFRWESIIYTLLYALGILGLLLSMSRAGWLGLIVAMTIFVITSGEKKIRQLAGVIMVIVVIVIALTPNLRYRFILPFMGEKSAISRLSLWHTGIKAIGAHPITGLGITGFSQNWELLNTDPNLDAHNFPHNLFLNFWVETGLLGLVVITGLLVFYIFRGLKNKQNIYEFGLALFLITFLIQGQIDNPYFKNDLAMIFWLIFALSTSPAKELFKPKTT